MDGKLPHLRPTFNLSLYRFFNTQSDLYVMPSGENYQNFDDSVLRQMQTTENLSDCESLYQTLHALAKHRSRGKQHYAFVLGQGGLFPCPEIAHRILSSRDGDRQRAILDLG